MAIDCASNHTAAGRESTRDLWLTRLGPCSFVLLPSLSESRTRIENGQMGPHATQRSCCCLTKSRSRLMIDRGVFWPIRATPASVSSASSSWAATITPGISRGISSGISVRLPASRVAGQDPIVGTAPERLGPLFHAPGRFLRGWAGMGEPAIKTLQIIKRIQRPAGTTTRLGRGWRKLPPECANLVDHQRQRGVGLDSNRRLPFTFPPCERGASVRRAVVGISTNV